MAGNELEEPIESAAPTPTAPIAVGRIGRRVHRRRLHRRMGVSVASVLLIGSLVALAVEIPNRRGRDTVAAGPAASRRIPVELHGDAATTELRLLDGSQLRLTLPHSLAQDLGGVTFADVELHASLSAGPPRGWRIDVSVGSVKSLLPGGEPLVVPPSSRASAAIVDPTSHRLGLQYGSWALVASGESMTDADIDALLTNVVLLETADGFVEYRGSLPLWTVDSPDAGLRSSQAGLSVFIGDNCPLTTAPRRTAQGLDSYRIDDPASSRGLAELCDRTDHLRIDLHAARPLTDEALDTVRLEVRSVGMTLAAVQRGEHP